jgi:glycosyltransferase involved in cell wall biosynthesis
MGVHMLALARHLTQAGVEVTLVYWPAEAAERLFAGIGRPGVATVRTPHPRDPSYGRELRATLRDLRPQVLHVHVGTGREDFGGARAGRAAGVPAIVETLHLPWLLHARWKRESFFHSLEAVDRLIVVSAAQRATYERIGVPQDAMTLVPNGVVPRGAGYGRAQARRCLGLDAEQPVLMAVGRLAVQKGHRHLVAAMPGILRHHPQAVALIVGDGSERRALAEQVDRLGLARAVRLLGERADVRLLLDAADVSVLPSLEEAMPLALLEAMDAGLPVVATRDIGTTEVGQDGVTGRLVPAADPAALAEAVADLLADPGLRRRLGEAGSDLFRRQFTAARMTADTLTVYRDTLDAVAAAGPRAHVGAAR